MRPPRSSSPALLLLLLVLHLIVVIIVLISSCSSGPGDQRKPEVPVRQATADAPETRYRVGDWIRYRYAGARVEGPLTLYEEVTSQRGNQLEIEVTLESPQGQTRWLQVLTDTPANQANNVVDELYKLEGDERIKLENEGNAALFELYRPTIPPSFQPSAAPDETQRGARLGLLETTCKQTRMVGTVDGQRATMKVTSCPEFLWTHGPARLADGDGRTLWSVHVVDHGTAKTPWGSAVTGREGFFPPSVVDADWLGTRGVPIDVDTLRSVRARTVKLVLSSGTIEVPEATAKLWERQACTDDEVRAWNLDRCEGLANRTCEGELCKLEYYGNCSGFLVGGGRLLTAAHCLADLASDEKRRTRSSVLRQGADGRPAGKLTIGPDIELLKKDFSHHWVAIDEPGAVDAALASVDDGNLEPWPLGPVPGPSSPTFLHGYPRVERRSEEARAAAGYDLTAGVPVFTFGRIADSNRQERIFCNPDGDQEHWRLEADCPSGEVVVDGTRSWKGPLTHLAFLGTWDTCNGASGAPVFDADGRLIGVNVTIMSPHDPQDRYSAEMFTVAVEAKKALDRLARR